MGIGLKASDMPHTKNGIRPDIIMNPNAIPSRMTIGQFWEQLMGKVGALLGINMDATAFEDYDIEEVKELLREHGYNETGEEYLYNGMSGQRMKTSIFSCLNLTRMNMMKRLLPDSRAWVMLSSVSWEKTRL